MKKNLFIVGILSLIIAGCNNNQPDETHPVSKDVFSGKVQKGPFVEG